MTDIDSEIERRLERLKQETGGVSSRADFTDRVMRAISHDVAIAARPGLLDQVTLSWRSVVPFAATLAVIAVAFATQVEPEADDTFATDYGTISSTELAYAGLDVDDAEGETW